MSGEKVRAPSSDVKTLVEIGALDIESAAFRASSKFAGKTSRATFAAGERFVRANRRREEGGEEREEKKRNLCL